MTQNPLPLSGGHEVQWLYNSYSIGTATKMVLDNVNLEINQYRMKSCIATDENMLHVW